MKLREYLERMGPGEELTCWDTVVDSEFYFYAKDPDEAPEQDEDFLAVDICMDKLAAMLDVVKIHDGGVEVNLYEMLEHPKVIQFAKENFYLPHQYEDDDDIVMLLFDDNDSNITNGFVEFSKDMVKCLEQAYGPAGEKYPISQIKNSNEQGVRLDTVLGNAALRCDKASSSEFNDKHIDVLNI